MKKSGVRFKTFFWFVAILLSVCSCSEEPVEAKPDFTPIINEVSTEDLEDEVVEEESFDELVSSYEDEGRQNWQKPRQVVQSLGDLSDKVVADIGAGTGYFTLRMLPLAKKVIAIDIDPRMTKFIDDLKDDLDERFSKKLETRLALTNDPRLSNAEADIVFLSNTYSYIEDRITYCRNLRSKMKPGGRIVIIDYKKKDIPVHPDQKSRIALYQVENELIEAGFKIVKSDDQSLPYQYIVEAKVVNMNR